MGDPLTDPTVVLVATAADRPPAGLDGEFDDGWPVSVVTMATEDAIVDRLEADDPVGCVLLAEPGERAVSIVERCRDADPDVPIVVASADPDLAAAVSTVGDVRFLGEEPSPERLRTAVESALADFDRRRRLREDATILRSSLAGIRYIIFAKDRDRRYVRYARVPGTPSPEEILGNRDEDFLADQETADERAALDRRVLEDGESVIAHDQEIETPGGTLYYRTSKVPWRDEDGEIRGLVGLTIDVTDEVTLEKQLAEQESTFETFARSISHDVRTPLQVARGNIELARETGDVDSLDDADRALDRIVEMIEDFETVAREQLAASIQGVSESPGGALVTTPIREVAEHLWSVLDTGSCDLVVDFPAEATIVADESSLRPLLENVLTNAIRHGGDGVTVRIGWLESGGFFVEDDGVGIPADNREDVLREGYTTAAGGTGTGLSIVTGIATRKGWDLEITESADGGARFEFHNCMLVAEPPSAPTGTEPDTLNDNDDVGDVGVAGTASYDGTAGRWIVEGAGRNVWQDTNEFHYVHASLSEPVRLTARIAEVDERSQYSKAGLMVRDSLAEDASYGYVGVTPRHGTEVLWRPTAGADGVSQHLGEAPLSYPWYRLDRRDGRITASISADGEEWHHLDQRVVDLEDPVYVGLVVCSHSPRTLCRATFEDVAVERLQW